MNILEADSDYWPELNPEITITDFKTHYWLKEELQNFCRKNGIAVTGSKLEISARIEHFLKTGEKTFEFNSKPKRNSPKQSRPGKKAKESGENNSIVSTELFSGLMIPAIIFQITPLRPSQ